MSIYIVSVLLLVLVLVIVILLHFYSVLVLVIVTIISLSIAILFYALVYDDDDNDDASLSSGAGTNLKVGGTCQARCPSFVKVWARAPVPWMEYSVTFVLQFHTRKHYKTAIQSECIASQELFSQCLGSNLRTE